MWGLWSNCIKVCLSSVLGPLGVMCCFPAGNCDNMSEVRFQYEIWNLLQKCPKCCSLVFLLKSRQNTLSVTFLLLWALGSCDPAVYVTAPLEEQRFWQLWHTELLSEKTYLFVGPYPDGFESLEQFISCQNQYLLFQLLSRRWRFAPSKQQEEGESSCWPGSINPLLKTCFIMRTRNSSCHSIL